MLWERINDKRLIAIQFSNFFDKTGNCAALTYYAVPGLQTSSLQSKNKAHFVFNLVQNWTSLLPVSKNNLSNSKLDINNQRIKKVRRRRSGPECWQENYNKNLEGRTSSYFYVSKTIPGTNIVISNWNFLLSFFICISSVFIIFHLHFCLSLLQRQSGRRHISIRSQISIKL